MDINRLIRIANHFDKIGAYTISEEFENKFIRTAAPVDTVRSRSKKVTDLVGKDQNLLNEGQKIFNRIISGYFNNQADVFAKYQYSLNTFKAWRSVISNYYTDTNRTNTKKAKEILKIAFDLNDAFNELQLTTPRGATSVDTNSTLFQDIYGDRERYSGNDIELLKALSRDISYEITTWSSDSTKLAYLSHLRDAEDRLADLATPPAAKPTIPPAPSTPAAAKPPPSTTTPSTTTPSPAAAKPNPAGGNATSPSVRTQTVPSGTAPASSGGTSAKPTSTKPTSKKPSSVDNSSEVLANIVFKKYKQEYKDEANDDIIFGMRTIGSLVLPTYLKISKNKELDLSIRKAIETSNYTSESKAKILKLYELKLKTAVEAETKKTETTTTSAPTPQPEPSKEEPKKEEPKKEDEDPKKYKFRCSREGLFDEIKRMDNLSENDPDAYMRDYFADIRQVIDCHSALRPKLEHKDNIQIDVLINILESKFFSLTNKKQFPY